MHVYYVSDLHIKSGSQKTATHFCNFLQNVPSSKDTLILGGDIFDLFVGSKVVFYEEYKNILQAINDLTKRGCRIYYLEGNHDFHMKDVFVNNSQIILLNDDFSLQWGGKNFWISHGDLINKRDYGYRFLHFITRNPVFEMLVKLMPGKLLMNIGSWSSKTSRKYKAIDSDEGEEAHNLRLLFRNYACEKIADGYDFVFIGHSHQRDQFRCKVNTRSGEYINLGFSDDVVLYAQYIPGDTTIQMKAYPT